jgi:hypothetical protein
MSQKAGPWRVSYEGVSLWVGISRHVLMTVYSLSIQISKSKGQNMLCFSQKGWNKLHGSLL